MSKKDFGSPQKYLDQFKIVLDQPKDQAYLTANIFEIGPMPTPWKFLDSSTVIPSC